mgnify:CR=1 FL=1
MTNYNDYQQNTIRAFVLGSVLQGKHMYQV